MAVVGIGGGRHDALIAHCRRRELQPIKQLKIVRSLQFLRPKCRGRSFCLSWCPHSPPPSCAGGAVYRYVGRLRRTFSCSALDSSPAGRRIRNHRRRRADGCGRQRAGGHVHRSAGAQASPPYPRGVDAEREGGRETSLNLVASDVAFVSAEADSTCAPLQVGRPCNPAARNVTSLPPDMFLRLSLQGSCRATSQLDFVEPMPCGDGAMSPRRNAQQQAPRWRRFSASWQCRRRYGQPKPRYRPSRL